MIFNSFNFWIIFPLIFIFYWLLPSNKIIYKKIYLITVSYLLYMNWKPAYALLLLGITFITYFAAKLIEGRNRNKKIIIYTSVCITILPLVIFKYYNFINDSIINILKLIGLYWNLPGLNIAIPIGISFFTFQALGYLWDVYYGHISAERKWWDYVLFVCFFPQIASGPISKAADLLPQIKSNKLFQYQFAVNGLRWLLWGMFLKVVVADRLGIYVNTVYENYEKYSSLTLFISSIFYTIQIYSDFAGYSYMALGIANLLGFNLINNFKRPYLASSITAFWKRWHISLTKWLTTYVYIPLGGKRCPKLRQYLNIIITFLVSGIWHGANWTFIIWGLIHGLIQIIEKQFGWAPKKSSTGTEATINNHSFFIACKIIITFLVVNFAWIFFRMPTISDAIKFIKKIIYLTPGPLFFDNKNNLIMTIMVSLTVVITDIIGEFSQFNAIKSKNKMIRWGTYIILFLSILLFGVLDSGQFIYVSF